MQLVADENVPPCFVERLRSDGHNVVAVKDVLAGEPDTVVLTSSNTLGFVLITFDRDFGKLAVAQGLPVVGVILLETERLSLGAQTDHVSKCLASISTRWEGYFTVIEPSRIRQREL
ncbi:MAG: DUF5615 family PIN-like protein [Hyphomicrobiaceae bacterium]|nr:DUF5615 family PIN-like protein [Hyphomicrobiaceae bacterium]